MEDEKLINVDTITLYRLILDGKYEDFPKNYWINDIDLKKSKECFSFLIENILRWDEDNIKNNLSLKVLEKYKLKSMLSILYNNDLYSLVNTVYPKMFRPWELKLNKKNLWSNDQICKQALKWLIEEKLKWSLEDIKEFLNSKTFIDNGLKGLLSKYKGSVYEILNKFYTIDINPWELKASRVPNNYWDSPSNRIMAIKDLIENKLAWNDYDIKANISKEIFANYNLQGLIVNYYNGNVFNALNEVYPKEFNEWELKKCTVRNNFWNEFSNREKAFKYLVSKNKDNICLNKFLTKDIFKLYNLTGLLNFYNGSISNLILELDKNKNKEWESKSVPNNFWNNKSNRIEAMDWLINKKLNWDLNDIKANLTQETFKEYGLVNMLKIAYNGSPFNAISEFIPNKIYPWELKSTIKGFWNDESNCKWALSWLVDRLEINSNNIDTLISKKSVINNNLAGLLKSKFKNNVSNLKEYVIKENLI